MQSSLKSKARLQHSISWSIPYISRLQNLFVDDTHIFVSCVQKRKRESFAAASADIPIKSRRKDNAA